MATKKRHFLKSDAARRVIAALNTYETQNALKGKLEVLETSDHSLILLNGLPIAFCIEKKPFFTVRGAIEFKPQRHLVTVDMGAVRFIRNGADVMSPGVVDADERITPGDFAVVIDERHKKPLGIGTALMSGIEMVREKKGKAVRIEHYVGDKIWHISP